MKSPTLLPLLAVAFILPGAAVALAGDSTSDAPAKKPIVRRATPDSQTLPIMHRDNRQPTPAFLEVRIARVHATAPWAPGAPGD